MIDFFNALINPNMAILRYALMAGILSSIPFGIIGSFVVVKRMTYIAGAVSHTVLAGVGLAIFLEALTGFDKISPMAGALAAAIIAGVIIGVNAIKGDERLDTVIGTVWAVGMSAGLILIHLTPNSYVNPMSYLFGNILLLTKTDLFVIIALNLVIIITSILFFNQFLAVSFDPEFSSIRGLNTPLVQMVLILLISLTVILMIKIVGVVMVIALLTIPPAISGLFLKRLKNIIFLSIALSVLIIVGGLFLSYIVKLPTGSTTVLLAGVLYGLAKFSAWVKGKAGA